MDKSMYSLILMDNLVKELDKLAHESGTSRSNLVNRILAQHLSILTPEMHVAEVFEYAVHTASVRQELRFSPPSGNMLVARSVLHYKYNPTIRYSVELTVTGGEHTGEFKAVSRSQSDVLLASLTIFFELWSQIEHTCLGEQQPGRRLRYSIASGRYRRGLELQANQQSGSKPLGEAIGRYIGAFDQAMSLYFSAPRGVDMQTFTAMLEEYRRYLSQTPAVL